MVEAAHECGHDVRWPLIFAYDVLRRADQKTFKSGQRGLIVSCDLKFFLNPTFPGK